MPRSPKDLLRLIVPEATKQEKILSLEAELAKTSPESTRYAEILSVLEVLRV